VETEITVVLYNRVVAYSMDGMNNCAVTVHWLQIALMIAELFWNWYGVLRREYLGFRAC